MATDPSQLFQQVASASGLFGDQYRDTQNNALNQQQAKQQLQIGALKLSAAQQQQKQEQAYQQDVQSYFADPRPQKLAMLIQKYPDKAEAFKQSYTVMDDAQRTNAQTQFGSLYNAANNGRTDLVKKQLEQIKAAEQAAGVDTAEIDDALAGLADPAAGKIMLRQIAGFAQMHLAAADPSKFATTYGAVDKGNEGFTLGAGMKRYDNQGQLVAEAPFAPQYRSVGQGDTLVEVGGEGGGQASGASGGGDIVARMLPITLQSESGNRDFNADGSTVTSSAGAKGRMQVMDGTNANPGYGVTPARDNSPEERARVGRDYLAALVQQYGDPAKAWAAYNAGPGAVDKALQQGGRWLQALPKETQAYVAKNMSALGSTGGGARVIAQGQPKQGYRLLTPEENTANGLDTNVKYQIGPDGQITALGGQTRQAFKQIPQGVVTKVQPQVDARDALQRALSGFKDDYGGHTIIGGLSNTMQSLIGTGPAGQRDWWADFNSTDNLIRNNLFGSALTETEKKAYEATTISPAMRPAEIKKNLTRRLAIVKGALNRQASFLKKNKYDPDAVDELVSPLDLMTSAQPAPAQATPGGFKILAVRPK